MPDNGQPSSPQSRAKAAAQRRPCTSREAEPDSNPNGEAEDADPKSARGDEPDKAGPGKPPAYKRRAVLITVGVVLLVGIGAAVLYWLHARHYESTDDAYIDGDVAQISPRVAAQVLALHINDNMFVHKGDLLIELDPTDYQVALEQAKAQAGSAAGKLDQARAQVGSARAAVTQAEAEIEAARVALENSTRELDRLQNVDERARSQQQLDNAIAAQRTAQAQVSQAGAKQASAEAGQATAKASVKAAEGELRTAQAQVHHAEVNLSYCRIYSPSDGRVTQRTVEVGNYVQVGQAMFLLVSTEVWVTANFKETQLKYMRPNEPVTIRIDAWPGGTFAGHVDSIQAGSGSRFSVLPAENATGNFVKVVQRVPVKIVFDHLGEPAGWVLAPGLSVVPRVRVR